MRNREVDGRNADTRRLPGESGVWIFIAGDMTVFAIFFVTYAYYFSLTPDVFLLSQAKLNIHYGAVNTILLLASSWFVAAALYYLRSNSGRTAAKLVALAFLCGLSFVFIKYLEYGEKVSEGLTLTTNYFFMFYFIFTGIHLLHVTFGMVVLAFLWRICRKSMVSPVNHSRYESGAAYWHMVDVLWIVLFPLFYLIQ